MLTYTHQRLYASSLRISKSPKTQTFPKCLFIKLLLKIARAVYITSHVYTGSAIVKNHLDLFLVLVLVTCVAMVHVYREQRYSE